MISIKNIAIGFALVGAFLVSVAMTPTNFIANKNNFPPLSDLIPKQFGDWKEYAIPANAQVTLAVRTGERVSDIIYDDTIMKTYRDSHGNQIMLAIAYGENQNQELKVHRPEVCYSAQGFRVMNSGVDMINLNSSTQKARRILAINGARIEPVTYFIRIGDSYVTDSLAMNFALIAHGLNGHIPDGILVRVSSISPSLDSIDDQYRMHVSFLQSLVRSSSENLDRLLFGRQPI